MRSPIVPLLVALNVLTLVLLAVLVLQSIATRTELDQLHREVAAAESGIGSGDLALALGDLENRIKEWLRGTAAGSPLSSAAPADARIDEILATLRRLEARVDQICEGVPVC
ncbi:MAG: hypothetical protein ABJB65_03925 [Chloroflexota bacterium]